MADRHFSRQVRLNDVVSKAIPECASRDRHRGMRSLTVFKMPSRVYVGLLFLLGSVQAQLPNEPETLSPVTLKPLFRGQFRAPPLTPISNRNEDRDNVRDPETQSNETNDAAAEAPGIINFLEEFGTRLGRATNDFEQRLQERQRERERGRVFARVRKCR